MSGKGAERKSTLWEAVADRVLEEAAPGPHERLSARLLVWMGVAMSVGGVIWTGVALGLGAASAAWVPASYVLGTASNLALLTRTGRLGRARFVQGGLSLLLPFVFQLALGGFGASGAVILWSMFAMVSALTASTWRGRLAVGGVLTGLLAVAVLADPWVAAWAGQPAAPTPSVVLLTMNVTLVGWLVGGLVVYLDTSRVEQRLAVDAALAQVEALNVELQVAEQAAREASAAKSEFLARMSHELRTPLNAILGYAELIGEEAPEVADDASRVEQAGRHLLSLVNDVLDLARVESGHFEPRPGPVCTRTLMGRVVELLEPLAQRQRVRLRPQVVGPWGVHTDGRMLEQILVNLGSNACKFTEDGEVALRIEVAADGARLELSVVDEGVGMDATQRAQAVQPFQQVEHALGRRHQGTGLGLPLVVEFARLLGGDFALHSRPGEGTEVRVGLPVRLAADPEREPSRRASAC